MDDRQFTQRALDCQRKLYRVALSMLRCDADAADAEALAAIVDAAQSVCTSYEKDCRIVR